MSTKKLTAGVMLLMLTLAGCSDGEQNNTDSDAPMPQQHTSIPVEVSDVIFVEREQWQALGQLLPAQQILLSMEVGGRVTERLVTRGDQVNQGTTLIRLDAEDFVLKRNSLDASIKQVEADQRLAFSDRDRLKAMLKRELVSEQDVDQIETRIESLAAQLARLNQERALANRQIDYTQLKAPVSGRINQVMIEPGQQIQPGQILLELIQTDKLIVLTHLPAHRMAALPKQAKLNTPTGAFELRLFEQEPLADPATGLFAVRYKASPDDTVAQQALAKLPLGERYSVTFEQPLPNQLQQIPGSALIDLGQGPHVWQIINNKTQLTEVSLVRLHNGVALIQPTLADDSKIVRHGVHRLQPDQAVRILND
ncbi:RND family efflux transporter, MFP subunit [Thiomicrospira sp. ALE5]|nr:RND family efflux transporter, MFP subunit [Thiomicrospira sp. ALE5]